MSQNKKYFGPGTEAALGPAPTGAVSFQDLLQYYASTPAGTDPLQYMEATSENAGVLATRDAGSSNVNLSLLYNTLIKNGVKGFYDFSSSACFPVAGSAKATPQVVPATTILRSLHHIGLAQSDSNTLYGHPYKHGETDVTGTPLNYAVTADGFSVGILFTDSNAAAVPEALDLHANSNYYPPAGVSHGARHAIMAIALETPATLSTNTDACLFSAGGEAPADCQVAFVVKDGLFGVYVNGNNFIQFPDAITPSTKYMLGVEFEIDPNDPRYFLATPYLNGKPVESSAYINSPGIELFAKDGTSSYKTRFRMPYLAQPWDVPPNGTVLTGLTSGVVNTHLAFGPQAGFGAGGQWAYSALGYFAMEVASDSQSYVGLNSAQTCMAFFSSAMSIPNVA